MQIPVLTALMIGAALLLIGGLVARRLRLPEATGLAIAPAAILFGLLAAPVQWREWLTGAEGGDRILAFARDIGLTGLFFIAGTRFDIEKAWKARRVSLVVALAGLAFMAVVAVLLGALTSHDRYAAVVIAAAIAATSLWLPSELSQRVRDTQQRAAAAAAGAAVILTGLSILVVHLYAEFRQLAGLAASSSAYAIVAVYELVKIAVFLSLAYLVASRFIRRAAGRVSTVRMTIGYLLIATLIYALAVSLVGQLGALGWSFVAGALSGYAGILPASPRLPAPSHLPASSPSPAPVHVFAKASTPIAVSLFLSLAFLPMLLEPHGRSITNATALLLLAFGAMACKFAISWIAARVGGASGRDTTIVAASMLPSAEVAVMFLGFGVTRWVIEGPEYFAVLLFAIVSMIVGPLVWRKKALESCNVTSPDVSDASDQAESKTLRRKRTSRKKATVAAVAIGFVFFSLEATARAQSAVGSQTEDPVSRAIKSIESSVDSRARAAEAVLAASKFVNESSAARVRGERDRARQALEEAEQIAAGTSGVNRSALLEDLTRLIAAEQAALSPSIAVPEPSSSARMPEVALPRSVLTRYREHGEALTRILREENVPVELLAVALVESGFNPLALSPKGARGIWQFMPATARRYGLAVRPADDHRTHPEHSTRAAARYLRDLYNRFHDWKLALAAYNAGEERIQRIIDRTGIRDFDEMARRGYLPAETRNYVPAVLAVWTRLGETNFAITTSARPEGRTRGGAVEALAKPDAGRPQMMPTQPGNTK
jgi:Kef-type K+ transport system membrane component KefB